MEDVKRNLRGLGRNAVASLITPVVADGLVRALPHP